jgi:ABC-2 type transport system ATP-binding protein
MNIPIVCFENISKSYPKPLFKKPNQVFQQLSFSCPEHCTLGLIGANGAGKSTSIKLLMDFIRPDSGKITLFGEPPGKQEIRACIGYLPETANFPANLNIVNMLNFTAATCNVPRKKAKERSEQLLKKLGLWEVRKDQVRTYSKGMQQRASFAIALINDPQLLVLDEPMSGLDPIGRDAITSLILDLKQQGKTILFCSHILHDVDKLADEILVLHKGKKLYNGSLNHLIKPNTTESLPDAYLRLVKEFENV